MDTREDELNVYWFKVESAMATHRKTRKIPRDGIVAPTRTAAMGVWLFAASWAAQTETDGFVPGEEFERWDPSGELTKFLIDAGYLDVTVVNDEPGYMLHDWLDVQQSKEQLTASRAYDSRKAALHRDAELTAAVRGRDGDRCRYCGTLVNWSDRRSTVGATYDHVDPTQGNTEDNVVVCCRGCNAKKAGRTPDGAGMPLLPPRSTGRPTGASSESDRNQIGTGPELALIYSIEEEQNRVEEKKKTPGEKPPGPRRRGRPADPRNLAAQEAARTYYDRVPMSNFSAVQKIARKALDANHDLAAVQAALLRLADDNRPVTVDTLRVELEGGPRRRTAPVRRDPHTGRRTELG